MNPSILGEKNNPCSLNAVLPVHNTCVLTEGAFWQKALWACCVALAQAKLSYIILVMVKQGLSPAENFTVVKRAVICENTIRPGTAGILILRYRLERLDKRLALQQ